MTWPTDAELIAAARDTVRARTADTDGVLDAAVVTASYDWLLRLVAARDRHRSRILKDQLQFIWTTYFFRLEDEGAAGARQWAQEAFRRLRLPRPGRTVEDDDRILEQVVRLRADLMRVFAKPWFSLTARNHEARPIVEAILRRSPKRLPHQRRLDGFVAKLLHDEMGFSSVRLSRARARQRSMRRKVIPTLIRCCRVVLSDSDDALEAHGWTRADIEARKAELEQELAHLGSRRRV